MTGVIYVMNEAAERGYRQGDLLWTNLGQGQPEVGPLPGSPPRMLSLPVLGEDIEYAPVSGLPELREAVADHYNYFHRRGKASQYTHENVCISSGGRAALTRAAAALGEVNLGHFLPDYTAYEELLGIFRLFSPIPILLDPKRGYAFSLEELETEIRGKGLSAILLSNPCNPTGKVVGGAELDGWCDIARRLDCAMLFDEFYSHYIWADDERAAGPASTAAAYVRDVNKDPVVIFDGLTKNWRYPGLRVAWTLGPKDIIEKLSSAGSFLDGGGSRPVQRAAIDLLGREHTRLETEAIRRVFLKKKRFVMRRLLDMGVLIDADPEGTFYVWGNLSGLPSPLNDGMAFFNSALSHQVICVPGEFFDVNPGRRRSGHQGRFRQHVRFSFGPELPLLEKGLDRLEEMIAAAR